MSKYDLRATVAAMRAKWPSLSAWAGDLKVSFSTKDQDCPTAMAVPPDRLFFNAEFWDTLTNDERVGLMCHEALHLLLLHQARRGDRDPVRWNIAADYAINAWIVDTGGTLPAGGLLDRRFWEMGAEEIYDLLPEDSKMPEDMVDLCSGWAPILPEDSKRQLDKLASQRGIGVEAHRAARACEPEDNARIPEWRTNALIAFRRAAEDFQTFDRRFLGEGLYVDDFGGERRIAVAIDTSGSVDKKMLERFVGVLRAAAETYGFDISLIYADNEIQAEHEIGPGERIPPPVGGGGTSFHPFFGWLTNRGEKNYSAAFYFTDLEGPYPDASPIDIPMWWMLWPGSPRPKWGNFVYVE